jgi:hypothetical protein
MGQIASSSSRARHVRLSSYAHLAPAGKSSRSATWFDKLAKFVDDEPIRARDKLMLGMLSSLGIEKSKPFKPADDAVVARRTMDELQPCDRENHGRGMVL